MVMVKQASRIDVRHPFARHQHSPFFQRLRLDRPLRQLRPFLIRSDSPLRLKQESFYHTKVGFTSLKGSFLC